MASSSKPVMASAGRRKSSKGSLVFTFKLPPKALQKFEPVALVKEESPSKESSSTISNPPPVAPSSNGDNPSESNADTPAATAAGTPVPSSMAPPTEGVKKKGVKRSAGPALGPDGLPKPRGKPGPKKKARLEDGSIDHSSTAPRAANATAAHKLGPKANQGAINAGLRALDRSGKPCRKWQKGSFTLKSFTGVVWEIPRWTAPPKIRAEGTSGDSASGDSSKENKDNSQMASEKSEKSNGGADIELRSSASNNANSSPPPSTLPPSSAPTAPVVAASA